VISIAIEQHHWNSVVGSTNSLVPLYYIKLEKEWIELHTLIIILFYWNAIKKEDSLLEKLTNLFISRDGLLIGFPVLGILLRVLEEFGFSVGSLLENRIPKDSHFSTRLKILDENNSIKFYFYRTYKQLQKKETTVISWKTSGAKEPKFLPNYCKNIL
jgi:hypothetical protein